MIMYRSIYINFINYNGEMLLDNLTRNLVTRRRSRKDNTWRRKRF